MVIHTGSHAHIYFDRDCNSPTVSAAGRNHGSYVLEDEVLREVLHELRPADDAELALQAVPALAAELQELLHLGQHGLVELV